MQLLDLPRPRLLDDAHDIQIGVLGNKLSGHSGAVEHHRIEIAARDRLDALDELIQSGFHAAKLLELLGALRITNHRWRRLLQTTHLQSRRTHPLRHRPLRCRSRLPSRLPSSGQSTIPRRPHID